MKTILLILTTCFLFSSGLIAQSFGEKILNNTTVKNRFTLVEEISVVKIVIPFKYNTANTEFAKKKILKIPYRNICKIEYIYSVNKDEEHQNRLNQERVDTLTSLFNNRIPRIYKHISLHTIIQIQKENKQELFNGFIITVENSSSRNRTLLNDIVQSGSKKNKCNTSCFNLDTLESYSYILPHVKADYSGYQYKTISKVFNRNLNWKNNLVVLDVTGSMTPYIGQYLIWLRLHFNAKENQSFVFFNDGNGFKHKDKIIGQTGGLYFTRNRLGYDHVVATITTAIRNGNCNHDIIENDIEAIQGGIKQYPKSKNIILIADNNAPPRDFELIKTLNIPVKVILCGTYKNGITKEYLNLALETGGSIHTIEEDR